MLSAKTEHANLEYGAKVSLIAIVRILALGILKAVVGYTTGMVVLVADALASFSDVLGLFATYIGLKISEKSADKGFRYGYYKVETVTSLIVSAIIIYFGIEILIESIERLQHPAESSNQFLGVFVVIIASVQSIYLAKRLKNAGKKINSTSLLNCGKDKLLDVYVQFAVLGGIAANYFNIPYLEGSIGIGISIMTLKVGYDAAKESLFFLLDYFDDQKLIKTVRKTILKKSKIVQGITDLRMRRAGTFIFGEAVLEINPYTDAKTIRNELKNLNETIINLDEYIKDFALLIAIPKPEKIRVAVPANECKKLNSKLAENMEETTHYIFVDIVNNKVVNTYCKKFTFTPANINKMVDYFIDEKTNIIINSNMHSLLFYNLRHLKNIQVYPNFYNVVDVKSTIKLLMLDL